MIAVLTGDLVNSTKLSRLDYEKTIGTLKRLIADAEKTYGARGETYRGDGFQIYYPKAECALKGAILIKSALHSSNISLKPIFCTLSLAFGELADNTPDSSSGPVFITSGRELEQTSRGELSLHFSHKVLNREHQLLLDFLNHLLNRLTKTQAALLYQYIDSEFAGHEELAFITKTSRQNISNRLGSMGANLIRDYIQLINRAI